MTILAIAFTTCRVASQSYSIDWYKVAGGGGTSTGGGYSLSGTIGQHDGSSPITGGNYSLVGGFWSLYAVQIPGAPLLKINRTSTNTVLVSWTYPSSGFSLQQNTSLGNTNWIATPESVTNNGTVNYIIVTAPTANRFYRLYKP